MKKLKLFCVLVCSLFAFSCEEKISEDDLNSYKSMMDVRLGHLGNAIIIQGRLLDAFNLRNDRADEDHFKEAEELVKGNLELFGRPDELKKLPIPSSGKLKKIHSSLIEASELLIQASNALEDNAWLGGSVSYAERNLEIARVNFQILQSGFRDHPQLRSKATGFFEKPRRLFHLFSPQAWQPSHPVFFPRFRQGTKKS